MSTESVKIDKEVLVKVRKIVKKTKQTIGGYIYMAVDAAADVEMKKLKIK